MKPHFKLRLAISRQSNWGQILWFGLVCALASLAVGCRKPAQTTASPAPVSQATNASQSAPTSQLSTADSSPALTIDATNAAPDLRPLNQALLEWRMRNRRVPANFAEFAASANTKIPAPPPGKKYIINGRGLISLVNANSN
jgi:hypothetical protein